MPNPQGYATGHVRHPNKDHLMEVSARKHRAVIEALALIPPPDAWDSRTNGWVGAIKDQSQCGSCWDFSGTLVVEVAHYKAGTLRPDQPLSEQYTLSCGRNGGCSGDDNVTVLDWAKTTGLPLTSDYGPYNASPGRCNWKQGMTLYKIDDWGFADTDSQSRVSDTEKIKAAIMQYGCVGCACDAGFNDPGTGVISGGGNNIDHDVALVGWQDTATKTTSSGVTQASVSVVAADGWWWMRNSWGIRWGDQGYARIRWKAWAIGTESVWGHVNAVNPPILWGGVFP